MERRPRPGGSVLPVSGRHRARRRRRGAGGRSRQPLRWRPAEVPRRVAGSGAGDVGARGRGHVRAVSGAARDRPRTRLGRALCAGGRRRRAQPPLAAGHRAQPACRARGARGSTTRSVPSASGWPISPAWAPRPTAASRPPSPRGRRLRSPPTTAPGAIPSCSRVASGPKRHELDGDVGARALMQRHPVVEVPCDDTGSAVDVDTPDDLRQPRRTGAQVKIEDQFRVGVPVDEAWKVLLDVERIAPCMPGAQLQEIEGDEYRGIVKVKVGPITAQYKGAARIAEADEAARSRRHQGRGPRHAGQGNASADGHRHARGRRRRHPREDRHRPQRHRQGRPVRPRRDGRRVGEAARPVRRLPAEHGALRQRLRRGGRTGVDGAAGTPTGAASDRPAPRRRHRRPPRTGAGEHRRRAQDRRRPRRSRSTCSSASSDAVIKRVVPIVAAWSSSSRSARCSSAASAASGRDDD